MSRRPGSTLIEVLVAIFIMGIGMLAILALFPLGALSMAQAIQDDRTAHIAANAAAAAQALDLRNDPEVVQAMIAPGGGLPGTNADLPSYPAYVDPIGLQTYGANLVGVVPPPLGPGVPASAIPRTAVAAVRTAPLSLGGGLVSNKILRWFAFLEDIQFDPRGAGSNLPAVPLQRDISLSHALMFRRPRSGDPAVVDMAVVVYNRRPITALLGLTPDEYGFDNAAFNQDSNGTPTPNMVTFNVPTTRANVPLRPGTWLLDASVTLVPSVANQKYGYANAYFYRAVNVTAVPGPGGSTTYEVEVGTPLRGWPPPPGITVIPRIVVMDTVVEVFEKGTGRTP